MQFNKKTVAMSLRFNLDIKDQCSASATGDFKQQNEPIYSLKVAYSREPE
jgi:hypothetical protein